MVVANIMIAMIIGKSTIVVVISMNIHFEHWKDKIKLSLKFFKSILKFVKMMLDLLWSWKKKMILMATMFDFSLEEQRGLIGFLNSWNYGVSLYIIITIFIIIISFFLNSWNFGVNCTSSSVSLPSLFVAKYNFALYFLQVPFWLGGQRNSRGR